MNKDTTLSLSPEDRKLLKELIKWIKFFPLMYLVLWVIMCLILFALIWTIFSGKVINIVG